MVPLPDDFPVLPATLESADHKQTFCTCMHSHGFAILRMENTNSDTFKSLEALRASARDYFTSSTSKEDRKREVSCQNNSVGVSYRFNDGGDEFLDVQFQKQFISAAHDFSSIDDKQLFRIVNSSRNWMEKCDALGRFLLEVLADHLQIPASVFTDMLTKKSSGQNEKHNNNHNEASVLRLTSYQPASIGFPMHTDSSLLTISPCSTSPGLEYLSKSNDWLCPEITTEPTDLLVHAGDILAFLTLEYFVSSVHHVIATESSRIGAPYLMRGSAGFILDTTGIKFLGENIKHLVQVENIEYKKLAQLLDKRGQRLTESLGEQSELRRRMKLNAVRKRMMAA